MKDRSLDNEAHTWRQGAALAGVQSGFETVVKQIRSHHYLFTLHSVGRPVESEQYDNPGGGCGWRETCTFLTESQLCRCSVHHSALCMVSVSSLCCYACCFIISENVLASCDRDWLPSYFRKCKLCYANCCFFIHWSSTSWHFLLDNCVSAKQRERLGL